MDKSINKKRILSNPVSEYIRLNPKDDSAARTHLDELGQLYYSLKCRINESKSNSGEISRQIGIKKNKNENCTDLIQNMQIISKEIRVYLSKLKEIEQQILQYFNEETIHLSPKITSNKESPNYARNTNFEGISIALMNRNESIWNDYVEGNFESSIYHRSEWEAVIKKTFNHDSLYIMAIDDTSCVRGILPLIKLKSRLFGNYMASMPYFNYGGVIADHPSIESILLEYASKYADDNDISYIEYRENKTRDEYPSNSNKVNMILNLPNKKEELWNSFSSKLRSQIKRSQRENLHVTIGRHNCLNDFYNVFARNMRDLGTPVYGKSFFKNILDQFSNDVHILVLKQADKPIAAAFLIGYHRKLEIPWASTIRSANKVSANMQLYWQVLSFAIQNKYNCFDFGRSSKDSGTYKFKQQWGALPVQSYWNYWLSSQSDLPALNTSNPKFALMINIWKRLPIFITKLIGPHIVKNIS